MADVTPEADTAKDGQLQPGLLRNSAVMAVGSIVSRVTGVLRNTALTAALGLTIAGDAFALGNSLPDIVYMLVIGGALNAVFVPQLVRRMHDPDGGRRYANSLLSVTIVLLAALTTIAVLAAPLIVRIYATDAYTPEQMSLAVAFARFCLPQIFFYGLYTMLAQVLNARGHFAIPMFAPILANLVAIVTYVSFLIVVGSAVAGGQGLSDGQAAWLGIGTTVGIAAQALILIPVVRLTGYRFRFSRQWRGMGLGKAGRLAGWSIGLVTVTQIAFVVVSRLATQANVNAADAGVTPAGLATYTNAYLVFMIPHGVITVSIVTAQLPGLSRLVHSGQRRAAGRDIGHTLRLVATVITPIAVTLLITAPALTALLFNYGAATTDQAAQLARVIQTFMAGLLPFTLYYVLLRGWYADEDTRTPFWFAVFSNGLLIVLALPLFALAAPGGPQVNALATAYMTAMLITFVLAWPVLQRRYGTLDTFITVRTLVRITLAAAVAAGVVLALRSWVLPGFTMGDSRFAALADLVVTSVLVALAYGLVALRLRVREARELILWGSTAARRLRRP